MSRLIALLICLFSLAPAWAAETVELPNDCVRCGMHRTHFNYSRAQVLYADGSSTGTCSIHCAVRDMKMSGGKKVAQLRVADYDSKMLIDAKSATWVVGGRVNGVMTSPGKWAFAKKQHARDFIKSNGGSIVPFERVMKALEEEVEEMDKPAEPE